MPLKEARIRDESELESILIKNPEQIEEDFKIITHQRKAYGQDRIDILGVDSQGILTIIELKVIQDINQLRQALNYYDWVVGQGLYWISDAYVNKPKLLNIPFVVPPTEEQQQIIEEVERHFSIADQIDRTIEQGLKQSGRLRQSILKKAFEGKLVPQDPGDEPAEKLLERIKAEKVKLQVG